MQKLFISNIRITVQTDKGTFGNQFKFKNGLNVIRAKNSVGKSTFLNSIIYALGFEILLGRKGSQTLAPCLKSEIIFENITHTVLESFVELEIKNENEEFLTIKRYVKSENDDRLIIVNKGRRLSSPEDKYIEEYYYLHDKGAAQAEKGFNNYLKNFVSWDLPLVQTFNNNDVPLYTECIFPLFFIEQKRGWGSLQATTPTQFGIKNVKKLAIEFVLKLDVSNILKAKQEINSKKLNLKSDWLLLKKQLEMIASNVNGVLKNYPAKPTTIVDNKTLPYILVLENEDWITIEEKIFKVRDNLNDLKNSIEYFKVEVNEQSEELNNLEEELFFSQTKYAEYKNELYGEKENVQLLKKRIELLQGDIKKNQDALKLQNYGANNDSSILSGNCPTCHQPINDTLLDQNIKQTPMTIEDNIEFLKRQREAASILLEQSLEKLEIRRKELINFNKKLSQLRRKIREIKGELIQDEKIPKSSKIRELVETEESLKIFENTLSQFDQRLNEINDLSKIWESILQKEAQIPRDIFSQNDKLKIKKLINLFRSNINKFEFRSMITDDVDISIETYKPIVEGFELSSDISASDNIRLSWAYIIALQEMKAYFDTNHLGLTIFDEPAQQEIDKNSKIQFYKHIKNIDKQNNQIIIATSEDSESFKNITKGIELNFFEFTENIIRPV